MAPNSTIKRATAAALACVLAACLAGCGEAPAPADAPQGALQSVANGNQGSSSASAEDEGVPGVSAAAGERPADPQEDSGEQPADPETHGNLGDFEGTELDKTTVFTQDDLAQKDATVINFWSTTCGPCINEMPQIAAFAKALPSNVQVITLCLDGLYNTDRAATALSKAGFDGVTLVKVSGGLYELAMQVQYTPTTVFVAQDGTLVGDALIGVPADLEQAYLDGINRVLAWEGKPAIALDEQHEDAAS